MSEDDLRLANLVTSYGVGTRSYNRSAEKRELKRQQKAVTEKYLNSPKQEYMAPLLCRCLSFQFPHELSKHQELSSDHDWRKHFA